MNLATPLLRNYDYCYEDDPKDQMDFLHTLNEKEVKLYTLGYIQASNHIKEAIVAAKIKFLNQMLQSNKSVVAKAIIELLDSLEAAVIERMQVLEEPDESVDT